MGQTHVQTPHDVEHAFAKNGCTIEQVLRHGDTGVGVTALSPARMYVRHGDDAQTAASRILRKQGEPKRVYYLSGTPWEQGYLMALLAPRSVIRQCTTYLRHTAPQFIAEDFDVAMQAAPTFHQMVYEGLLDLILDLMIHESVAHFWRAVENGDVPAAMVEELRGLAAGIEAKQIASHVSLANVIAANYGMDYVMMLIFSGRLVTYVEAWWAQLPQDIRDTVPFRTNFLAAPDMCNAFMVRGAATQSGKDVWLLRDFQFNNAHVFHETCTLVVRRSQAGRVFALAAAPGMVGGVTGLNDYGVACGVNMVRSSAVDPERLGLGCLLTMRLLTEHATSTADAQRRLEQAQKGCPWLFYAVDGTGDMRVFETVANRWTPERLTVSRWVHDEQVEHLLKDVPLGDDTPEPAPQGGVWVRRPQGDRVPNDETRRQWSAPLLAWVRHPELSEPARWGPEALLYPAWQQEVKDVHTVSTIYFPPRRDHPDMLVVNNTFHHAPLRLTQMTQLAALAERTATANQWRYDTLTRELARSSGQLDRKLCWSILTFLSPWKQPHFPQNAGRARQHIPDYRNSLKSLVGQNWNDPLGHLTKPVPRSAAAGIVITGCLCLVDPRRLRIKCQAGLWGSDAVELDLRPFRPA